MYKNLSVLNGLKLLLIFSLYVCKNFITVRIFTSATED